MRPTANLAESALINYFFIVFAKLISAADQGVLHVCLYVCLRPLTVPETPGVVD